MVDNFVKIKEKGGKLLDNYIQVGIQTMMRRTCFDCLRRQELHRHVVMFDIKQTYHTSRMMNEPNLL